MRQLDVQRGLASTRNRLRELFEGLVFCTAIGCNRRRDIHSKHLDVLVLQIKRYFFAASTAGEQGCRRRRHLQ
jgi:hypothetical protein